MNTEEQSAEREGQAYEQAEAFCLMTYACKYGHRETIWNSRDGVTPFIVTCARCGAEANHVDWGKDVCDPLYQPKPGERFFVSMTPHDAEHLAREVVDRNWDAPDRLMQQMYEDKADAIRRLSASYNEPTGQPRLVTMQGGALEHAEEKRQRRRDRNLRLRHA